MDEHPPAPLDDPARQGYHKRHIRVDRVADEDLAFFDIEQVGRVGNDPGRTGDDARPGWLANQLTCLQARVTAPGGWCRHIRLWQRSSRIFQSGGQRDRIAALDRHAALLFHAPQEFLNSHFDLLLNAAQDDVVVVAQPIAGAREFEQFRGVSLLLRRERFNEPFGPGRLAPARRGAGPGLALCHRRKEAQKPGR